MVDQKFFLAEWTQTVRSSNLSHSSSRAALRCETQGIVGWLSRYREWKPKSVHMQVDTCAHMEPTSGDLAQGES